MGRPDRPLKRNTLACIDTAVTLDDIARETGISRQRVQQVEVRAMAKARCAFAIDERLGPTRAAPVLEALRGRGLPDFEPAARAAAAGRVQTFAPEPPAKPVRRRQKPLRLRRGLGWHQVKPGE